VTDYLTDGSHVLIAGATGSGEQYGGKSVLANWWYNQSVRQGHHDLGVYFDPKGLSFVRKRADATVSCIKGKGNEKGIADYLKDDVEQHGRNYVDNRVIQYVPDYNSIEHEHERLTAFLRQLTGGKIVVHDEAHEYADSLGWYLSQAGNLDNSESETTDSIRSLAVTQRAWNLPDSHRANLPLKIWVGPMGSEGRRFFQSEQMKRAGELVQEHTGQYRWSVTDAGDYVETNGPVPEKYA